MLIYLKVRRKLWKKELSRTIAPHYRQWSGGGLWNLMAWLPHLGLSSLTFCPCQLDEVTISHQIQWFGCKTCLPLFQQLYRYSVVGVFFLMLLMLHSETSFIFQRFKKKMCQKMNEV